MNRITSIFKMNLRNKMIWFYLPFFILLAGFLTSFMIYFFFHVDQSQKEIINGGISAYYVYLFVLGIVILRETFPFSIGFSVSRKDYFWGNLQTISFVSAINSALLVILALIEKLTGFWGVSFHFFYVPYLNNGPIWQQWIISFILQLHVFYYGIVIASIYWRFRYMGITIFLVLKFIFLSTLTFLVHVKGWWTPILKWFTQLSAFELSLYTFPLTIFCIFLSYLLLRRTAL